MSDSTEPRPLHQLARILFEKMEHLDPSQDQPLETAWDTLSPRKREFFVLTAENLVAHRALIEATWKNN